MACPNLFAHILDSTAWGLSKEGWLLWITMLAKQNRAHIVNASVPGLAHAARLTAEETEKALEELHKSRPYSVTSEDGHMIEAVEGGWLVLDGAKYRAICF